MSESRQTDKTSRAIIRKELLTNILVEAGAGSGKTQMLAERMAAGIASGDYQVEHMAAVTFTRKAASELRGRFHLALERELENSTDSARTARVQSALSNLERFFAGTIHSFCARLLRERPVESGVSPGFTELDEVQDLELRQRVWRDFTTSARAAGDPDMIALMDADVRPKDLDSAFAVICGNDDVEFPPGDTECPNPKHAWKALDKFWKELQKHLPAELAPDTKCAIQLASREFRGKLRVSQYQLDRPDTVATLLDPWDCESKITQYRWADAPAEKKRLRDLIQPLHADFHASVVEPYLSQWRQYVYRLSVTLLARARDVAGSERRRLNTLNYGDLLNLTARVLRENSAVRTALQRKFKYLLVDEFQDTDPVQAEILFWLAQDSATATPKGDWRTVPLRPGALFVVGDPKQSIYRFRRADIDIYNIVRDRFSEPAVGRVVPLTMNFRSVPQLCNWANEVFQARFPAEPTPHAPRFAALDPNASTSASGGVFTLTHTCDKDEILDEDARKIATYIRAEVDAGRRRFSDFLILTRKKRGRIAPYADALESLNIPLEVSGAGAFGDSAEVKTLTSLLRVLADPMDALQLVAVLRGPLFGISDPELFQFKQSGGWFSIFHKAADLDVSVGRDFSRANDGDERVVAALDSFHRYHRWTRVLPAAAALERILEDTGYLAFASTAPGGVDAGDVLHAVDRVRRVVEEGGSLADAADALEADSDLANEVESLPLEPGRTDVVRVMNLHKAKGLEADVVFLADPAGGLTPRVDVHIERTGLQARGWFKIIRRSEGSWAGKLLGVHADWPGREAAELPYLLAEEDRLLYVAATRAREMLVVSRWTGNNRTPAWGALNKSLATASELPIPPATKVETVAPLDCRSAAQTAATDSQVLAHAVVNEPSWAVTSVTAEAKHISRITRSSDPSADDPSNVVATNTPTHRADAGQAWGTLIHGLLEHAMRHKSSTRDDLRRLAAWLTVEEPQLRPVIEIALDTVESVAQAPFWVEAKASHERHEEVPFARRMMSAPSLQILNGTMDLVYRRPSDWRLLDYKTDSQATPDDLKGHYQQQIDAYGDAWSSLAGGKVTVGLMSVRGTTSEV